MAAESESAGRHLLPWRRFAEIRDRYAPSLRTLVTADGLRAAWDAEVAEQGPLSSVGPPLSEPAQHVDPAVVADIADWLARTAPSAPR